MVKKLLIVIALCLLPTFAMAQSFNCNYAQFPDEVLICQDPTLSAMDRQLATIYFSLRNRLYGAQFSWLLSSQTAWLAQRFQCGRDYTCIQSLYATRIQELLAN